MFIKHGHLIRINNNSSGYLSYKVQLCMYMSIYTLSVQTHYHTLYICVCMCVRVFVLESQPQIFEYIPYSHSQQHKQYTNDDNIHNSVSQQMVN